MLKTESTTKVSEGKLQSEKETLNQENDRILESFCRVKAPGTGPGTIFD